MYLIMENQRQNYFLNLLKATRVVRVLIPLSSIMLVVGFANQINKEIFILAMCCVLIYSAGGILNAKFDKDFKLKHPFTAITFLFIIVLILSFTNYIIFLAVITWVLLSFVYSKFSRRILFGDSTILAVTHAVIPIVASALLLGLETKLTITLAIFMFVALFLIIPMKNLNRVKEDKKRKYKTLMTYYKNGKKITYFLFNFYFILMFIAYFVFDLTNKYLIIFAGIFIITIFLNSYLNNRKEILAYKLSRLIVILFSFAFVYDKATDFIIISISGFLIFVYIVYLGLFSRKKFADRRNWL